MIKRKRIVPDEEYERRQKEAAATEVALQAEPAPQPKKRGAINYVYFTDAEIAAHKPKAPSST
jgi:hypothetical protein